MTLDTAPIDRALAAVVPDPRDRAFVLRCIVDEGPRHHRIASWALLRMIAAILDDVRPSEDAARRSEPLPIRLPPGVEAVSDDAYFPLGISTRMLREVLGEEELALAVDALGDGPAHHALANAAMVALIETIHQHLKEGAAR